MMMMMMMMMELVGGTGEKRCIMGDVQVANKRLPERM